MANRSSHKDESGRRNGGSRDEQEGRTQSSTPGSYDGLLHMTEQYYGYGDEDYGKAREEDERYWHEQEEGQRGVQTAPGDEDRTEVMRSRSPERALKTPGKVPR